MKLMRTGEVGRAGCRADERRRDPRMLIIFAKSPTPRRPRIELVGWDEARRRARS